jgi:phage-related tail protein
MRAILCLGAVMFLASCDSSKHQLETAQANLTDVTKQRDDLKAKVASLQEELDATKVELAKAKAVPPAANGAVAAKAPETKSAPSDTKDKAAKAKHGHKS